jgi:hypothetical protein
MTTAIAQAVPISPSSNVNWQNSIELTVRIILAPKTLADGLFAQVLPQYLASHYVYEGQNPGLAFIKYSH